MQANPVKQPLWRTLLILGRISNLPTVWSNCLVGWWLAGAEGLGRLILLCTGASFLYVGGMYLNDACDSGFDAQYRRERPIPSGAIRAQTVWILSCAWLAIGFLLLVALGKATLLPASALLGCIVMYDVLHKKTFLSPVLMAACRFLLYPTAVYAAGGTIDFPIFWFVGALGAYVIGLSYLARNESKPGRTNPWPLALLAAPILMSVTHYHFQFRDWTWLFASVLFAGFAGWLIYRLRGSFTKEGTTNRAVAGLFAGLALLIAPILIVSAQHRFRDLHWLFAAVLFAGWLGYCLRAFFTKEKTVGGTVAGLLAGIVLVDLLVIRGGYGFMPLAFLALFATALVLQRFVPAT